MVQRMMNQMRDHAAQKQISIEDVRTVFEGTISCMEDGDWTGN